MERLTGVRADTIRHARRRRGDARDERRRASRAWVPAVRGLLGKLPDTAVARRAGVTRTLVAHAREELGIPVAAPADGHPDSPTRRLDQVAPREVLRLIRARARSGRSLRASELRSARLLHLAEFHFGGWYQAVRAAGLLPPGNPRVEVHRPGHVRPLTDALLRGPLPSAELERRTGVARETVRTRRARLGIFRYERRRKDRRWLASVRRLLGEVPDPEIARRVGVSRPTISLIRAELGIPPAPRPSGLRSPKVAAMLARYSSKEVEHALALLDRRPAAVVRARILAERPQTLERVGRRLGITKQSVRWHERAGLARLLAQLAVTRTGFGVGGSRGFGRVPSRSALRSEAGRPTGGIGRSEC